MKHYKMSHMSQFHLTSFVPISNVPCSVFFFFSGAVWDRRPFRSCVSVARGAERSQTGGPYARDGWRWALSVCVSLVRVGDWLTAVMFHRRVTYGCNLALITYTITLTLIRLSLRWAVTDAVGGKNACSGFSDGWTCWCREEFCSRTKQTLANLRKAIMQRLKADIPEEKKPSWFHAARRRSEVISPLRPPCRVMNHRQRCGPDPGVALLWTTTSSPNNLLNDCRQKARQPPGVTLPRQPWREVGGWSKQRIIPEIEMSKRRRSVDPRAKFPHVTLCLCLPTCWMKVPFKATLGFKCCDAS